MDATVISLVSASTALVASIAGPLVTLAVARRQFNASVISANRQKWMETLRDTLAELISHFVAIAVVKRTWQGPWDRGLAALSRHPELIAKLERLMLIQWRIRLLVNPAKQEHLNLVKAIEATMDRIRAEGFSEEQTKADVEHLTALAQVILRSEWGRVKRGI